MEGTVKKLTDKGFGFISIPKKKDMFFHARDLKGVAYEELNVGDKLRFDVAEGDKGPYAVNVERITN